MRLIFAALFVTIGFTGLVQAANPLQEAEITTSDDFIKAHPDLMFRTRGILAYNRARYSDAFVNFKRAAKFADKPSQGMMAEMLWKGQGVGVDKVQAYAWIDIAAERGYPAMMLTKENMWSLLSEAEREQAVATRMELSKYYGDKVAKKRLEAALRRKSMNVIGSRVGYASSGHVCLDTLVGASKMGSFPSACKQKVETAVYYQDKYWKAEEYLKWKDIAWQSPTSGKVNVLPLETVPNTGNGTVDKK